MVFALLLNKKLIKYIVLSASAHKEVNKKATLSNNRISTMDSTTQTMTFSISVPFITPLNNE